LRGTARAYDDLAGSNPRCSGAGEAAQARAHVLNAHGGRPMPHQFDAILDRPEKLQIAHHKDAQRIYQLLDSDGRMEPRDRPRRKALVSADVHAGQLRRDSSPVLLLTDSTRLPSTGGH